MAPDERSPWSAPETVAGFLQARPNETLLRFAAGELARARRGWALDLGCGAGRNALPLAALGWDVAGLDNSWPMLRAAARRAREAAPAGRVVLLHAAMDRSGLADASCELVVAHGVWNLARSSAELWRGVAEAARVAKPGAGLFVFTFSRRTLAPEAAPVAGERCVFTQFSGAPQVFLTERELVDELAAAGFRPDAAVPLVEHNVPRGASVARGGPAIWEGAFRRAGAD